MARDRRGTIHRDECNGHRIGSQCDRLVRKRRRPRSLVLPAVLLAVASSHAFLSVLVTTTADAFRHNSCSSDVAKQFQFADCYLPDLADDLSLSDASFLMSHNAATGYLKATSSLIANGATNLYTKTQIGSVYRQLEDGARALDVRPKLLGNGTVVLHHGAVPIPVTLATLVSDARQWAEDNPDELVLILHSNFAYPSYSSSSYNNDDDTNTNDDNNNNNNNESDDEENSNSKDENDNDDNVNDDYYYTPSADTTYAALSSVYAKLGVNYVQCSDVYGLTVGEAKELAALSAVVDDDDDDYYGYDDKTDDENKEGDGGERRRRRRRLDENGYTGGGYLLAMDRHDAYAGSCAKQNWVENSLVTCYSSDDEVLPCTDRKSIQHRKLKEYAIASANNAPTDNTDQLGPPASLDYYPFSEIQTLWQVDGTSVALGMSRFSSIIDDNSKSHLNARIVDWIYDDAFDGISLLVADHVRLNGNAITSVLRNRCGQSELSYDQYEKNRHVDAWEIPCGTAVMKPHLRQGKPLSTLTFFATTLVSVVLGVWIAVGLAHYRKHHDHAQEVKALERDLQDAVKRCGCADSNLDKMVVLDDDIRDDHSSKTDPLVVADHQLPPII